MKNVSEIDFRWQRIVPIMLCLTAISYYTGQIGANKQINRPINTCNKIEKNVNTSPNYIGGDEAMLKYNQENIFPILSDYTNRTGEVIMKFKYIITISTTGAIVDCEIEKELPEKVIHKLEKVLYNMPKWEPAIKNGTSVCYKIKVPIYLNWK